MQKALTIKKLLKKSLAPKKLEVIDESWRHKRPSEESHFHVYIISSVFDKKSRIARHRMIHKVLDELLPSIHALSIEAYSPEEEPAEYKAPPCRGQH